MIDSGRITFDIDKCEILSIKRKNDGYYEIQLSCEVVEPKTNEVVVANFAFPKVDIRNFNILHDTKDKISFEMVAEY